MTLRIRAETVRATELAREAVKQAADVLRLYDSAAFRSEEVSACVLLGSHFTPERYALVVLANVLNSDEKEVVHDDPHTTAGYPYFKISLARLRNLMALGLPAWDSLLRKDNRNDFEEAALSSVALYTRGATKQDLSDRLIYAFAG